MYLVGSNLPQSLASTRPLPRYVSQVTAGSPADKAQLLVGDYLLKVCPDVRGSRMKGILPLLSIPWPHSQVNSQKVAGVEHPVVINLIKAAGDRVVLTVESSALSRMKKGCTMLKLKEGKRPMVRRPQWCARVGLGGHVLARGGRSPCVPPAQPGALAS